MDSELCEEVLVRFTRRKDELHPEQLLLALHGICQSIEQAELVGSEPDELERVEELAIAAVALASELTRRCA